MIVPGDSITHFHLNPGVKLKLIAAPVEWGHRGLSEVTFYRTYSRQRSDRPGVEDWGDCVVRVIEGMFTVLKTHARQNRIPWSEARAQKLAAEAAVRMHQFKWLPPGRGLWMMGTDYVYERGGMALQNCAFVSTQRFGESPKETVDPFRFMMDVAMLGVGPGFDTRGAGGVVVHGELEDQVGWVVEDSREGWVDVVAETIESCIFGGPTVVPDVSLVRPEGSPLRSFGGTSSGPLPLIQGLYGIRQILGAGRGRPITSVMITDLMNIIGKIVVSGNIRRTAEIGFSEPDDHEFADMKDWERNAVAMGNAPPDELREESPGDYETYLEHQWTTSDGVTQHLARKYADRPWAWKFGGWRWASNNSLFAKVGMDYSSLDDKIARSGEPGLAWLDLMRSHGRLKDPPDYRDHRVMGCNPCVEQTLESYECCTLVENFPSHAADYWDFQRSLKFSYLYAKTVTLLGSHWERSNQVMIRNRRIGCSMSGVADAIATVGRTEFLHRWCEDGYRYVSYLDKKYSDWLGVRESIKKTSEKPSGTVSLVAGVYGPGCHFPKRTGYRTMRVPSNWAGVQVLEAAGYRVEPAVSDPARTSVAYFPWVVPEGVTTEEDATLWEQVKVAVDMQHWWADNQVSYTACFTREEAESGQISRVLQAFDGQLKGISFLEKSTAAYAQMPFTEAPREEVLVYQATLRPLKWDVPEMSHDWTAEDKFCDGAACEVRVAG